MSCRMVKSRSSLKSFISCGYGCCVYKSNETGFRVTHLKKESHLEIKTVLEPKTVIQFSSSTASAAS